MEHFGLKIKKRQNILERGSSLTVYYSYLYIRKTYLLPGYNGSMAG